MNTEQPIYKYGVQIQCYPAFRTHQQSDSQNSYKNTFASALLKQTQTLAVHY
jgi:hypothetical protein